MVVWSSWRTNIYRGLSGW